MPQTMPYGTVSLRHESDEVDTYRLLGYPMLHEIVEDRTLHSSTLRIGECIKWMTVRLIVSISNLDEYCHILVWCDDIDLSSSDLIVGLYDRISLLFEVANSSELSLISHSTTRWLRGFSHGEKVKQSRTYIHHTKQYSMYIPFVIS